MTASACRSFPLTLGPLTLRESRLSRPPVSVIVQGRHVSLKSSNALNRDYAEHTERKRQARVDKIIDENAARKKKKSLSRGQGTTGKEDDQPGSRSAIVRLTDKVLRTHLEKFRQVDTSALNFKDGLFFVSYNFSKDANGPQIQRISEGLRKALKAHPVFKAAQGTVWRELSPDDKVHEHAILHLPEGGDVGALSKFLVARLTFYVKKERLNLMQGAIKVERICTREHWENCCEYAGKAEKQEDRVRAHLPGGGAWRHNFKPLPVAPVQTIRFKSTSQYFAFLALISAFTGKGPGDFRTRNVHLSPEDTQRLLAIVETIGEHDVPWIVPGKTPGGQGIGELSMISPGVAGRRLKPTSSSSDFMPEYISLVITDNSGYPRMLKIWYGEYTADVCVEVSTGELLNWGMELLGRADAAQEPPVVIKTSLQPECPDLYLIADDGFWHLKRKEYGSAGFTARGPPLPQWTVGQATASAMARSLYFDINFLRRLTMMFNVIRFSPGESKMPTQTIFQICDPRPDVLSGTTKDEHFAADLAKVLSGKSSMEYTDPATFFANTFPTRGIKELLKAVCHRLSGSGKEVASVIRLDTQYGGGKTHGLIALVHAVRGKGVANIHEFVDPGLLPSEDVLVAAYDGDNADPANGFRLEDDLFAFTPWGQIAYQLAGRTGYERVRTSDEKHTAPGAATIKELFQGRPTLIVLDEIAVYLRKAEKVAPGTAMQFSTFIRALIKAVSESPKAALVYTLAVGKDEVGSSGHREENLRALEAFAEAEQEDARQSTQINPTEEDETADVLRRRLFAKVDPTAADQAISAYIDLWKSNRETISEDAFSDETKEQFRRGYPLHPELLEVLTEKTSSLSNFQRTRGMLRLLARTIHDLWKTRPADAYAIHPHHINFGLESIRSEILTRLQQGHLAPPLKGDVEAVPGDEKALAEVLDAKFYPGQTPVTKYVARTVFLNTLAYGDDLKGVPVDRLMFSVASPALDPAFVEQARTRFIAESLYLDDRPGAPMRFAVEPNLTQMIRRQMRDVDAAEVRSELNSRIKTLFTRSGSSFDLIAFPGGPYEVPDDVGDGRPLLILLNHEALALTGEPRGLPIEVADIFEHKGAESKLRELRNNLVFLVADARERENMRERLRRRLALRELQKPDSLNKLADYQQDKLKAEYQDSDFKVAQAVLLCYRHVFFPSHAPFAGSTLPIAYTSIEVTNPSDRPGDGQRHVMQILREQKKILSEGDSPDAPGYVRDQTPMKVKGSISTMELRMEFRKAPKLSILLNDGPLLSCIREGIQQGVFVYREGDQVWGQGDTVEAIHISENAYVHTALDAKKNHLYPRPEPLRVTLTANPDRIALGVSASLAAEVSGGVPPYIFASTSPKLSVGETPNSSVVATISPSESQEYRVEVTDARGHSVAAMANIWVASSSPDETPTDPKPAGPVVSPPPAPKAQTEFNSEGHLAQALPELFDKVRKANVKRLSTVVVKIYESSSAFKVQQALATLQGVEVSCEYEVNLAGDGVESMEISFHGRLDKANSVKAFLDAQIRSAGESHFISTYTMKFAQPLSTDAVITEKLTKDLIKYGAGEAYVEAHAAPTEHL